MSYQRLIQIYMWLLIRHRTIQTDKWTFKMMNIVCNKLRDFEKAMPRFTGGSTNYKVNV